MVVMVLLGVMKVWLGGTVSEDRKQSSRCGAALLCSRIRKNWPNIIPLFSTDVRHKLSTHMIDQSGGAVEALKARARWITRSERRVWNPAALNRILKCMNPPGMAAGHLDDVYVTEEDHHCRNEVGEGRHKSSVAGTAAPVNCTAVHGNHIADRAPAQQGRATGDQSLQPDPQHHDERPPQGAAGAVAQAVHDGVVAVKSYSSYCQYRCCAIHRGGVTHK